MRQFIFLAVALSLWFIFCGAIFIQLQTVKPNVLKIMQVVQK